MWNSWHWQFKSFCVSFLFPQFPTSFDLSNPPVFLSFVLRVDPLSALSLSLSSTWHGHPETKKFTLLKSSIQTRPVWDCHMLHTLGCLKQGVNGAASIPVPDRSCLGYEFWGSNISPPWALDAPVVSEGTTEEPLKQTKPLSVPKHGGKRLALAGLSRRGEELLARRRSVRRFVRCQRRVDGFLRRCEDIQQVHVEHVVALFCSCPKNYSELYIADAVGS